MTIEYLNSLSNQIGNLRDHMIDEYKKFISDKSIPLDRRWIAFEIVYDELPKESWGDGFIDVLENNGTLYDDFYIERYETTTYKEMWERILDRDFYDDEVKDAWREAVLDSGDGSFRYDW